MKCRVVAHTIKLAWPILLPILLGFGQVNGALGEKEKKRKEGGGEGRKGEGRREEKEGGGEKRKKRRGKEKGRM